MSKKKMSIMLGKKKNFASCKKERLMYRKCEAPSPCAPICTAPIAVACKEVQCMVL